MSVKFACVLFIGIFASNVTERWIKHKNSNLPHHNWLHMIDKSNVYKFILTRYKPQVTPFFYIKCTVI